MRCKNCGQRLPEYAKICPMCKTPVTEEQRQEALREQQQGGWHRQGGYGQPDGWSKPDYGYSKEGGWGRYPDSYGNQNQNSQNDQGWQENQGQQDSQGDQGWQDGQDQQSGWNTQNGWDQDDPDSPYGRGGYGEDDDAYGRPYGGFPFRQPVGFAERLASLSMTLGIFNLIMMMVYPGVAIGLAVPGLISAILGVRSERRYRAVAGIVLNVIAILMGICMQILLNALQSKM